MDWAGRGAREVVFETRSPGFRYQPKEMDATL